MDTSEIRSDILGTFLKCGNGEGCGRSFGLIDRRMKKYYTGLKSKGMYYIQKKGGRLILVWFELEVFHSEVLVK